jgi:hypothetical protein
MSRRAIRVAAALGLTLGACLLPLQSQLVSAAGGGGPAGATATPFFAGTAHVSPGTLTFGSQEEATTSPSRTVKLANHDVVPLVIHSVAVKEGDVADFVVTADHCGHQVNAGNSCEVEVAFRPGPGTFGPRSSTLQFDFDNAVSPQSVTLIGRVASPDVHVEPSDLSFGAQQPGTASAGKTVTVRNGGGGELRITDLKVDPTDDFSIVNGDCLRSIGSGASCSLRVVYSPKNSQGDVHFLRSAILTITDNDAATPTQLVALVGTVPTPDVQLSTTSLSFAAEPAGTRGPDAKPVTLRNSGDFALIINALSFAGIDPDDFQMLDNTCPGRLEAGQSCIITVAFDPVGREKGPVSALLKFEDDAPGATQTVALHGTVVPGPAAVPSGQGAGAAAAPAGAAVPSTVSSPAVPPTVTQASGSAGEPGTPPSLIERRATASYVAGAGGVARALDVISRASSGLGGYVASSDSRHNAQGAISGGHLSVRVPATADSPLSQLVTSLSSQLHLTSVGYSSVDRTVEALDLHSRLATATSQHDALVQARTSAPAGSDTAALDQQIAEAQQSIGQLDQQVQAITRATQMATAAIDISERGAAQASAGGQHNAVVDAVLTAFTNDGSVLRGALSTVISLLPFALLAALAWLARRLWLRRRSLRDSS